MYKIKKEFNISSSHRLHNENWSILENKRVYGKCNNEPSHGHNYKIILTLKRKELRNDGMVLNFYILKDLFQDVIDDIYDHKFLNTCPGFKGLVPTAENMCKVFYDRLKEHIPELCVIEIYETDGASAIYEED